MSADDPAWRRFPGLHEKLVLTYDNTAFVDGAGAQLQRIYGTYAIARLIGAAYIHTPIARIAYQGLSAREKGPEDPAFPDHINQVFQLPSDVSPVGDFHEVRVRDISMDVVQELVDLFDSGGTGGRPILVHLVLPYGIADDVPDCYEVCKNLSPFESAPAGGRPLRVALHVRRGELFAIESDRMLPNAYYIAVAREVADALDGLGLAYEIELWTEVPTRPVAFEWDDYMFNRLDSPMVVDAAMSALHEFDDLPNLVPRINGETIDCFRGLATADVLVMSRSSLSYVCGVLSQNSAVLCYPFWHVAPSAWITVQPDGQFDRSRFATAVAALG